MHCGEHVFFAPNQSHVKWIAWDITACSGHHRERRQAGLMLVMAPERRQRKIREREIGDEPAASNHQPSQVASHPNHPFCAVREVYPRRTGTKLQCRLPRARRIISPACRSAFGVLEPLPRAAAATLACAVGIETP